MFRPRGMRWAGVALLAMLLSACSANADILEASTQGDERTLNLIIDTCNADLTTEVEESRSRVVVNRRLIDRGTGGLVSVMRDDP